MQFCERYKDHVIPLSIARPILATKRGVRATSANQSAETEDATPSDDELVLEDDLSTLESEPTTDGKKPRKPRTPHGFFSHLNGKEPELLDYDGKTFVRFVDVLPPCPPKGEFDVNKIRLSPYFFS